MGGYTKHGARCLEGRKESIGLTGVIVAQGIMAPKMPRLHLRTCSYASSGAERDFREVINRGSQDGERRLSQITGVAQGGVTMKQLGRCEERKKDEPRKAGGLQTLEKV